MSTIMFWLQPLIAAFTGWITIWLTIKLLFRPRVPMRILGMTLQGIVPKQQAQAAARIGKAAAGLIHFDEIAAQLKDPELLRQLNPTIEKHLDHFLEVKLKEKMPIISMFVGSGTLDKIKEGMMEEIATLLPEIIGQYTDSLSDKIDIEQMVAGKISGYPINELEEMVMKGMSKELRLLQIGAALVGLLIGLVQMGLSLL